MEASYTIRKATLGDSAFVAEAIINAEKSNTDKLSLATFFNVSEEQVTQILLDILEEEIEGCEFSIDSFLVVDFKGQPVAAVAGWIENYKETLPSKFLKSNLISFTFPPESLAFVKSKSELVTNLLIEREKGALQIEYVYTAAAHRGKRLAQQLIDQHWSQALATEPTMSKMQVQLFSNNVGAIKLYERAGFKITEHFVATQDEILNYLPFGEKILMEKSLNMERNILVERLKEILVGVLKHEDFEMTDEITASEIKGWDSLSHMIIITEIEKAFGIRFRLKELNKLNNMGALINLIETKSQ